MQCRYVGVADECLWIAAKEVGVQIRKNPHRAVATRPADHRLDLGISPDRHQIFRPLFILMLLESAEPLDLGLEDHLVSGLFHGLHAAAEPAAVWSVRRTNDTDRI